MESIVESLNTAYLDFIAAIADALEARDLAGERQTPTFDATLEAFKQRLERFRFSCDQAEEFIESMKKHIHAECLIDESVGVALTRPGQPPSGIPPTSAVRLEQMGKVVRQLEHELGQGSGVAAGVAHPHASSPFDAKLLDSAQ